MLLPYKKDVSDTYIYSIQFCGEENFAAKLASH